MIQNADFFKIKNVNKWIKYFNINSKWYTGEVKPIKIENNIATGVITFWNVVPEEHHKKETKIIKGITCVSSSDIMFLLIDIRQAQFLTHNVKCYFGDSVRYWNSNSFKFCTKPSILKKHTKTKIDRNEDWKNSISKGMKKMHFKKQLFNIEYSDADILKFQNLLNNGEFVFTIINLPSFKTHLNNFLKHISEEDKHKCFRIFNLIWCRNFKDTDIEAESEWKVVSKAQFLKHKLYDLKLLKKLKKAKIIQSTDNWEWNPNQKTLAKEWKLSEDAFNLNELQKIKILVPKDFKVASDEIAHLIRSMKNFKLQPSALEWFDNLKAKEDINDRKLMLLQTQISNAINGQIDFKIDFDGYGKRFHSTWTSIKKEVREFVYYDDIISDDNLIEIDASNSQFQIFAWLIQNPTYWKFIVSSLGKFETREKSAIESISELQRILHNLTTKELNQINHFCNIALNGNLYQFMQSQFNLTKYTTFSALFANERDSRKTLEIFNAKDWSVLTKLLNAFHQNQVSEVEFSNTNGTTKKRYKWKSPLPMVLQRIESTFWARGIAQRLHIPFILIHDSLIIQFKYQHIALNELKNICKIHNIDQIHLKIRNLKTADHKEVLL